MNYYVFIVFIRDFAQPQRFFNYLDQYHHRNTDLW